MNPFITESLTSKGGRQANEDALGHLALERAACWVVADGLGGHRGGAIASRLAVDTILESFRRNPEFSPAALEAHLVAAHHAILERQRLEPGLQSMRTTAVVLITDYRSIRWAHVGDSRLYCIQAGRVIFQTRDHSVPQMMADAGDIRPDQIRLHEDRSRLLKALGMEGELRVSVQQNSQPLYRADAFLLCVDGFWEYVLEREMESTLVRSNGKPGRWLGEMKERLKSRASRDHDNYTAIAIQYNDPRAPLPASAPRRQPKRDTARGSAESRVAAPYSSGANSAGASRSAKPSLVPKAWMYAGLASVFGIIFISTVLGSAVIWLKFRRPSGGSGILSLASGKPVPGQAIVVTNGPIKFLTLPAGWVELDSGGAAENGSVFRSQEFQDAGTGARLRLVNRLVAPAKRVSFVEALKEITGQPPHKLIAAELKPINKALGYGAGPGGAKHVVAETENLSGKQVLVIQTREPFDSGALAAYSVVFCDDASGSSLQELRFESSEDGPDELRAKAAHILSTLTWSVR